MTNEWQFHEKCTRNWMKKRQCCDMRAFCLRLLSTSFTRNTRANLKSALTHRICKTCKNARNLLFNKWWCIKKKIPDILQRLQLYQFCKAHLIWGTFCQLLCILCLATFDVNTKRLRYTNVKQLFCQFFFPSIGTGNVHFYRSFLWTFDFFLLF